MRKTKQKTSLASKNEHKKIKNLDWLYFNDEPRDQEKQQM